MIEIIHGQEARMIRDAIAGNEPTRSKEAKVILNNWIADAETGALGFSAEAKKILGELLPDWLQ